MTAARSILRLPIADIAVGNRVGYFKADHAAQLGEDMAANGQHDPIHVRRNGNRAALPWSLVAGLHRLRGAEGAGWAEIDAIQVADAASDAATLLRLELSENLDHRQRRPIERSTFIAARARLEEGLDHPGNAGEARHDRGARLRWEKPAEKTAQNQSNDASDIVSQASGWRARTAAAMGCTVRTVERYQALYSGLVEPLPDLAEQLDAHPVADNMAGLLRIAKLPLVETRRKVVEIILADPELASIDAALVAAELSSSKAAGHEPIEQNRFLKNAWSNFDRLGLREQRAFVRALPGKLTPGLRAELLELCRKSDD